jgi:hypothetical protein
VLIANPGTKRCDAFLRSLPEFGQSSGTAVDGTVVPWADVIRADGRLDDFPAFDRPAIVRLESPGKDDRVTRQLCGVEESVDLPKGILFRPARWYTGFCRVLEGLRRSFDSRPHLTPTACPLAVAAMFDKNGTLATLRAAAVPVPDFLPPNQIPNTPDELLTHLRRLGWTTAYVKLNTGASAMGIVVARFDVGGEPYGTTTIASRSGLFFNTRQLRSVRGEELRACLGFLLTEGATVQCGLTHAQMDGQNADLRVVCVAGRPVATVFRLSSHPITNLHLGGRRGDWARCRQAVPTRSWLDALDHCAAAAGCFDAIVAGVDLVFEPGYRRHHVLEVNAFGDFFPGWVDAGGRSIHHHQIAAANSPAVPRHQPPDPFDLAHLC